jgi:AmmeMemoRadiSam system protein A/AmmeMemoRadiSam system protein B
MQDKQDMKEIKKAFLVPHPPLIIPGVGKGDELPETRRAYTRIVEEIGRERPETIIVISPHSVCYADYFHISSGSSAQGDFGMFRAPQVAFDVQYDEELADYISVAAEKADIQAGKLGERDAKLDHGTMVPLYFLREAHIEPRVVRIGLSGFSFIDHYRFGMCIREAADTLRRKVVLIASGDMSHKLKEDGPYGFAKEGAEHDAFVKECIDAVDFRRLLSINPALCELAAECGFRSLVILAGFLDGMNVLGQSLSYEDSFGVGYLTATFAGVGETSSLLPVLYTDTEAVCELKRATRDPYTRLAMNTVEHFVRTGKTLKPPADLPEELLTQRAGVFVSLKKDGVLRGCIGTIAPIHANIAREIIASGVSAASQDPRFSPVTEEELDSLSYSVDVLSPPEPISGPDELNVIRYGVIASCGSKRGVLLPNLDGVRSVEDQIAIALRKGGIRPHEHYTLERFEVVRHA